MPLEIDKAVTSELHRLEAERTNRVEATVTQEGVEAEIRHERNGWSIAAYAKRLWKGPWFAGGRVRKEF